MSSPPTPRLTPIPAEQMTADQRRVAEAISAGPRKGLRGPFNAWLRSPELADRLQRVGEFIRFHSSLDARLNELAILMTAAHWSSPYEWYAHYPLALKAGLRAEIADAIGRGERPVGMHADEEIIWEFCTQLRARRNVDDKTYAAAVAAFGEVGVVDLIGANGYYDTVSMTLNVAEIRAPEDAGVPFKPPKKW